MGMNVQIEENIFIHNTIHIKKFHCIENLRSVHILW